MSPKASSRLLDGLLEPDGPDDFRPTASWENLRLRAKLLRRTREFFERQGFLEVETPIISADTVVDRHLDPFSTGVPRNSGQPPRRLWLQTSPEFAMKRILAARAEPIYQITRAFRLGEFGPLHNPEFTMVEWYYPGDDLQQGMQRTDEFCQTMLDSPAAETITYGEAFERHVGIDPHTVTVEALATKARELDVAVPDSLTPEDRDGWLDLLLAARVQPQLGGECPVLLYDYPASQSALCQIRSGDPPVAERFELYVSGIELANGYAELLDAKELRRRNRQVNAQRRRDGKSTLPETSRLLEAMEAGLPRSAGVALGFDRLVMLAAGATTLAEVMAFPFDRA